jgi:hypothetical protein
MKFTLLFALMLVSPSVHAFSGVALPTNIPIHPDMTITPGDICTKGEATELRYAEKIPYCRRAVTSETKDASFDHYDAKYQLRSKGYNRSMFKMDHLISLCMGGSNDISNLWPQHMTVALLTDRIEELLCIQMAKGQIKQSLAIDTMIKVKLNLNLATLTLNRLIAETKGPLN